MNKVDGNALAGPLSQVFGEDVTTRMIRCPGCLEVAELARTVVYANPTGLIARCRDCDALLATVVETSERIELSLTGHLLWATD